MVRYAQAVQKVPRQIHDVPQPGQLINLKVRYPVVPTEPGASAWEVEEQWCFCINFTVGTACFLFVTPSLAEHSWLQRLRGNCRMNSSTQGEEAL
jgi:hypothetical protein